MKKLTLVLCAAIVLGGCASTPSKNLDLTSLADKTFVLNEISMMVRKDIDKDGSGAKFVGAQREGLLKAVQSTAAAKGLTVETGAFAKALDAGTVTLKKDDIDVSADFKLYWYHWTVDTGSDQNASINVTLVQTEKGVPASVTFSKTDPDAPQKPFSTSAEIYLQVTSS